MQIKLKIIFIFCNILFKYVIVTYEFFILFKSDLNLRYFDEI